MSVIKGLFNYGIELNANLYRDIINDYYPQEKTDDKSFSTVNFNRAVLCIRNENLNIKSKWDSLINSFPVDVIPPPDKLENVKYVKLLTAVCLQIYWFTNIASKIEGIIQRDDQSATTSESVGSHTITQSLGAQILQMNSKNSYTQDVYTLCPDVEQILMDMGWLDYRL